MQAIFDVGTQTLTIEHSDATPTGSAIKAVLARHGQTVVFADLAFGAVVTANGSEIKRIERPRPGEVWVQSDQDLLVSDLVQWQPDQQIEVYAWIRNAGELFEATASFTAPRPKQPYPSWTWDGTTRRWQPPVPYPDDALMHEWDEGAQEWQPPQAP